jgi:hypothetical protein
MRRSSAAVASILLLTSCAAQREPSLEPGDPTSGVAASTAPQPSAADSEPIAFEDVPGGSRLEPGTYVLHYSSIGGAEAFPTLAITFTVPALWERVMIDGLLWNDAGAKLGFLVADNIYADPCDAEGGPHQPAVGASVDDLVTALTDLPGWEGAEVSDETFQGYRGMRIEVTNPGVGQPCEDPVALSTHGNPGVFPAPTDERLVLHVLDVDGTRLVVAELSAEDAANSLLAELQAVVDSVEIEP